MTLIYMSTSIDLIHLQMILWREGSTLGLMPYARFCGHFFAQ